jgi:hypothetical protein
VNQQNSAQLAGIHWGRLVRGLELIEPLDLDRKQPAAIGPLQDKLNRLTADLAILDIGRLIGCEINAGFQPFTAVRTLDGYKLFRQQAR